MEMITGGQEYALTRESPFQLYQDLGVHRPLGDNGNQQCDNEVKFNATKNVFLSEANIQQAVNAGLNEAVPAAFRRTAKT